MNLIIIIALTMGPSVVVLCGGICLATYRILVEEGRLPGGLARAASEPAIAGRPHSPRGT